MDGFAASFGSLRCTQCAGGETVVSTPWAVRMPAAVWDVMIYVFDGARCRLDLADGSGPVTTAERSIAVVLRGLSHSVQGQIASTPRLAHHADPSIVGRYLTSAETSQTETATHVEVLGLSVERGLSDHLFGALPAHFLLEYDQLPAWLGSRLRCLKGALTSSTPGAQAVALRDAEALMMQVVSDFTQAQPHRVPGWWRATEDPKLARVQALIHRDLARSWTIEMIAAEAGMSRSRLIARAAAELGEGLMSYLTRARMWEAARQLERTRNDVARIGRAIGYGSEKAFITSFSRFWKVPPGEYRRLSRAAAEARLLSDKNLAGLAGAH